jgi:hypothetical protein
MLEQKMITTRLLRRRKKIKKGKLETKILGAQHGQIHLLLPELLKDNGRLSAYLLLAHKMYWCIVALAFSHCVSTYCLLERNFRTAERIFISFIIWVG